MTQQTQQALSPQTPRAGVAAARSAVPGRLRDVPLFSAEIKIVDESYRRATTLPAGGRSGKFCGEPHCEPARQADADRHRKPLYEGAGIREFLGNIRRRFTAGVADSDQAWPAERVESVVDV